MTPTCFGVISIYLKSYINVLYTEYMGKDLIKSSKACGDHLLVANMFSFDIMSVCKAITFHLESSYDKQNLTLMII